MPLTAAVYGQATRSLFAGQIAWETSVMKAALLTSAYVPNLDTHRYLSDVQASEVAAAGYNPGGVEVQGKTATYDATTNTLKLDAADVEFSAATLTARYAVFYALGGNAAASALICLWDFGTNMSTANAPLTLILASGGLVTAQAP